MPVCMYCLVDKAESDFNREHVVPEAFGRFADAPVLHNAVCENCNSYFGETLDRILARGTPEGLQRYVWGVKDPRDVRRFEYHNLRLSADVPGDYAGALLHALDDTDAPRGLRTVPITQVGFANLDGDEFTFFPLAEVRVGGWRNESTLDWRKGVKIIGPDIEEARAVLEAQGVHITNWREMEAPPEPGTEIDVIELMKLTPELERAIAKIAFNYAAYTQVQGFALREQFHPIRRYIRYGEHPGYQVLGRKKTDIFTLESESHPGMVAVFHVVTITEPTNAEAVLAQVSLFNWMQWEVALSQVAAPSLRRIGHLFNIKTRTVHELGHRGATTDR